MASETDPNEGGPEPRNDPTVLATPDPVMDRHMGALIGKLAGADAPEPLRLGPYHQMRRIGAGGMGEVFAARQEQTGEIVALKTLSSTTAARLYRFKREFRSLADVSHPNLVRLHELYVPETGPAFFTMELLDGVPFVAWVRNRAPAGQAPDLARLEHGLRQLVEGVLELHANDCLHRDIKPSNVLVTQEGRVVVLDFGLVSDLSEPERGITRDRQVLGTPGYMAPEQALGQRVGPAADIYAIGVMLFECLTGHLPHPGTALEQLIAKHDATPDPGDFVDGIPEELRTLCIRLLARDPGTRPSGRELRERLRAGAPTTRPPARSLVGRGEELGILHCALQAVGERQEPVILHLRGRSGDGKSALVRRFRFELRDTPTVVLHGRCREREMVPYKGLDSVVDALSVHLWSLEPAERAALRPPDLDVLVRLFPVLGEIWEATETQNLGLSELRMLGGVTLRRLLVRIAERWPLIVHIDDVQWADLDSVGLLQDLARSADAPAMLLLLSYRNDAYDTEPLRTLLQSEILAGPRARFLELAALPSADARELAETLLQVEGELDPGPRRVRAEAIALRSGGSPFFIAQMVLSATGPDSVDSDLDHVLARRLERLESPARSLLEIVAVFGGPLPAPIALDLSPSSREADLDALCELGLLVREAHGNDTRNDLGDRVETSHDRVREVALAELRQDQRTRLHRQIGELLLARHAEAHAEDDIFALVHHLDAGVEDVDALPDERRLELAKLNHIAGERALESTAWVAARRHLSRAHELVGPWLAEARDGRGPQALCIAVVFGWIQAELTRGNAAADTAIDDLLEWKLPSADLYRVVQWYGENLSLRAQFERCVTFSTTALARLGVRVATRPSWFRAVLSYLWGWRALRRVGFDRVLALPPVHDDRMRTGMALIATAGGAAAATLDLKAQLHLMGTFGRLLTTHGFHEGAAVAFASLAMSAAALGRTAEARTLCEVVEELLERREISTSTRHISQAFLLVCIASLRPAPDLLSSCDRIIRRTSDVASRAHFEILWFSCTNFRLFGGTPLSRILETFDDLDQRDDDVALAFVPDCAQTMRSLLESLIQGGAMVDLRADLGPSVSAIQRSLLVAMQTMVAVLCGDHELAWECSRGLARGYARKIGPICYTPVYAMVTVILMAERWPSSRGGERRRMRSMMRKRRATARHWAEGCRESFQPMLDVIDGELASLDDRHDAAVTAYERARTVASENQMHWLTGLASERLAKLARRRGHTLAADAAFDTARSAYEAWGAMAVVQRIDRERAR